MRPHNITRIKVINYLPVGLSVVGTRPDLEILNHAVIVRSDKTFQTLVIYLFSGTLGLVLLAPGVTCTASFYVTILPCTLVSKQWVHLIQLFKQEICCWIHP